MWESQHLFRSRPIILYTYFSFVGQQPIHLAAEQAQSLKEIHIV